MKRMLVLVVLLCVLPCVAWAEEAEVSPAADDDARIYVIKKGDTLWGISKRFSKDPEYWPNLWANNPFVTNPHLIYPGQKIKFHDGRIEIVPTTGEDEVVEVIEAEEAKEEAATTAVVMPKPVEKVTFKVAGGEGYVREDLEAVGLIADTIDNRYMMVAGDTIFVTFDELGAVRPGDRFDVIRPVGRVSHPESGRYLGEKVSELGMIEVKQIHDGVATAEVLESEFEIQRGDLLTMHVNPRLEIALKKSPAGVFGVIVEARKPNRSLSENDFVYVDVGSKDGLEKGNMLYIARERRATELAAAQNLRLPDRLMGAAVLVDVGEQLSTALVIKSVDVIARGDKVFTQSK